MNRKILMILFVLFTFITAFVSVYAKNIEAPEDIRIGIFYGSKAVEVLTLSSPGGIEIGVMTDGEFEYIDEVGKNEKIKITKAKNGSVYIDGIGNIGSRDEYPYFKAIEHNGNCVIDINGRLYRGNVEIKRLSNSDMTVINHLSMQEYLYGVVPVEIGRSGIHVEALKAQAVAARTYATKNYNKRSEYGFNLDTTTNDQVYGTSNEGGYECENEDVITAVDETYGQVMVCNETLISANYFSTSGGYTEASENVWGGKVEYLKAVPDIYEIEVKGNTSWEVEYTSDEIEEKLRKKGIDVGEVVDLVVTRRTDSGRVVELKIVGTEDTKVLTNQNVRTYFGLKSQWYTINEAAPEVPEFADDELPVLGSNTEMTEDNEWWLNEETEYSKDEEQYIVINPDYSVDEDVYVEKEPQKENKEEMKPLLKFIIDSIFERTITKSKEGDSSKNDMVEKIIEYKAGRGAKTFVFKGRGNGHGVGMSQNGAKGMALAGFTYEEILTWYYTGVEIVDF